MIRDLNLHDIYLVNPFPMYMQVSLSRQKRWCCWNNPHPKG